MDLAALNKSSFTRGLRMLPVLSPSRPHLSAQSMNYPSKGTPDTMDSTAIGHDLMALDVVAVNAVGRPSEMGIPQQALVDGQQHSYDTLRVSKDCTQKKLSTFLDKVTTSYFGVFGFSNPLRSQPGDIAKPGSAIAQERRLVATEAMQKRWRKRVGDDAHREHDLVVQHIREVRVSCGTVGRILMLCLVDSSAAPGAA